MDALISEVAEKRLRQMVSKFNPVKPGHVKADSTLLAVAMDYLNPRTSGVEYSDFIVAYMDVRISAKSVDMYIYLTTLYSVDEDIAMEYFEIEKYHPSSKDWLSKFTDSDEHLDIPIDDLL